MRIACVQTDVRYGDATANATKGVTQLRELAAQGVELALFPEAFLTGYCAATQQDACSIAIRRDDSAIEQIRVACEELNLLAVVGFAERCGDSLFNSAALFEPGQVVRFYRKTHLPFLGMDRFMEPGTDLPLFETRLGKLGLLICFDLRPPEATRSLALAGAEILLLPTNWPVGAETSADHISIARAAENRIFVATCNRIGQENGFTFIGRSKIIAPSGKVLTQADDQEAVLIADIDLAEARNKRTVNIPGEYETDVFASRQPCLYGNLVSEPNRL
jgi:predicted amidohydrolase